MAKKLAMLFGVIFIVVGILGFFNNPIVGMNGFFMTNVVHNVIHLLVGIIMVIMASRSSAAASLSMTIFGIVYLLIALLGFVSKSPLLGLVMINGADNWLHVVLGIVLLALGLSTKGSMATAMPSSGQMQA